MTALEIQARAARESRFTLALKRCRCGHCDVSAVMPCQWCGHLHPLCRMERRLAGLKCNDPKEGCSRER